MASGFFSQNAIGTMMLPDYILVAIEPVFDCRNFKLFGPRFASFGHDANFKFLHHVSVTVIRQCNRLVWLQGIVLDYDSLLDLLAIDDLFLNDELFNAVSRIGFVYQHVLSSDCKNTPRILF